MAKFHVGQIVRKKSCSGDPVGEYMKIYKIEKKCIYANVLNPRKDSVNYQNPKSICMLNKENVYIHTINSLCISEDLYYRLVKGYTICAQHLATAKWLNVLDSPPELIRFYTQAKNYQAVFVVENVRKTFTLNEQVVKIVVSNLVL